MPGHIIRLARSACDPQNYSCDIYWRRILSSRSVREVVVSLRIGLNNEPFFIQLWCHWIPWRIAYQWISTKARRRASNGSSLTLLRECVLHDHGSSHPGWRDVFVFPWALGIGNCHLQYLPWKLRGLKLRRRSSRRRRSSLVVIYSIYIKPIQWLEYLFQFGRVDTPW